MVYETLALTLDVVGKVFLAIMALSVHRKIRKEHKIDLKVLRRMRVEQLFGVLAIIMFIVSYILLIT